jgi:predicted RNA binding protein YcfA (HicA-like mRNA interferase family)
MTRSEKLFQKLSNKAADKSWSFEEVTRLLNLSGYSLKRVHGSHHIFSNDELDSDITIPRHGSIVKPAYIRQIRERISQ